MIKVWDYKEIIELWNYGYSASRIKEKLGLDITVRHIQRIGADQGNRSQRYSELQSGWNEDDHYFVSGIYRSIIEQLMVKNGQDPYTCTLCGKQTTKKMTIHHTKYEGATIYDLVFACWSCQHQFSNHGLA